MASDTIAIPLSRLKIAAFFGGSLLFLTLAIGLIVIATGQNGLAAVLCYGAGGVGASIAALMLFLFSRKLFDPSPGLVIDAEGILDNASPIGAMGRISWQQITRITVVRIYSPIDTRSVPARPVIIVGVRHPQRCLEVKNPLERFIRRGNYNWFGSPVRISSAMLGTTFAKLEELLQTSFSKYRGDTASPEPKSQDADVGFPGERNPAPRFLIVLAAAAILAIAGVLVVPSAIIYLPHPFFWAAAFLAGFAWWTFSSERRRIKKPHPKTLRPSRLAVESVLFGIAVSVAVFLVGGSKLDFEFALIGAAFGVAAGLSQFASPFMGYDFLWNTRLFSGPALFFALLSMQLCFLMGLEAQFGI